MNELYDIIIVGGGPAGLSAAHSACENGAKKILILERDREVGGILQQCIHNGFGLHHFKEELTGPGYSQRCYNLVKDRSEVKILVDTMVLEVREDKTVIAVNPQNGLMELKAKTVILTMGCRERTRGAIRIPGFRPAGVYTAGAAQRMVNMEGYLPGKKIVILGSGDIGLIMARRMSLEGCKVQAVLEICPFSNGLTRNMVQCLNDYDIPLYLSHTITMIKGKDRIEGIQAAKVDDKMQVIPGTEFDIECDTLLLSVGLIPENELSRAAGIDIHPVTSGPIVDQHRETSIPGIFAAGNVVHVHDLVDFVSDEAEIAGKYAALTATGAMGEKTENIAVEPKNGVRTCVPQHISKGAAEETVRLFMRVTKPMRKVKLELVNNGEVIMKKPLPIAKPSEMIAMDIPADKIQHLSGTLEVAVNEGV
jgi:NADPH-dependent 2,4-dienoyl-CoA reductase/sulfur reductase-like enzyme